MMLRSLLLLPLVGLTLSLPQTQKPLLAEPQHFLDRPALNKHRPLHGRFLHITGTHSTSQGVGHRLTALDFHPDQFYKTHASAEESCHRGTGSTGVLGAETSDCDSPFALVNATFAWLKANVREDVDFVIWTGDSARHDNDEQIPRKREEVIRLNEYMVNKMREVFGKKHGEDDDDDPTNDFVIPVVPTFGNNDVMPHNIMDIGPNFWTNKYTQIWRNFIPEAQKHSFERGGWFFVEVIPEKLAVFNLNTMYFFNHNGAVDGCAKASEPGYEQMQWLRIQLEFLRRRGIKAIMMGHVPPAKTENKEAWDSTCWQLYTLWMRQYRDVVVGSMYGHMNIDHFMLQDFHHIKKKTRKGKLKSLDTERVQKMDEEISIQSSREYLSDLRHDWSKIPDAPAKVKDEIDRSGALGGLWDSFRRKRRGRRHRKSKKDKYLKKIGGQYAERYSVSLVSASVVPNYFPTFRIVEYNTTGLDNIPVSSPSAPAPEEFDPLSPISSLFTSSSLLSSSNPTATNEDDAHMEMRKKHHRKKHRKHKKKKKSRYTVPTPPSKSSPPGPAYSAQSLTWLGYQQYYANLTLLNTAFEAEMADEKKGGKDGEGRKDKGNKGEEKKKVEFAFELEYDTRNDTVFGMKDLTVRSWVDLARRIGKYRPLDDGWGLQSEGPSESIMEVEEEDDDERDVKGQEEEEEEEEEEEGRTELGEEDEEGCGKNVQTEKKKHKRKRKGRGKKERKEAEELWFTFLRRAYVGAKGDEQLREDFAGL